MSWEYYKTTSYDAAIYKAKELGWKEKRVQIRVEFVDITAHYYIEPPEQECACPHILKYNDHVR